MEPLLAVGNEELIEKFNPDIPIKCPHCHKTHPIEYGKNAKTGKVCKTLAFYKCTKLNKTYLYGIDGKIIKVK